MVPPETTAHADQVPSLGVVEFPVRVSKVNEVLAGWLTSEVRLSHCTDEPASNNLDTKTPVPAYGLICTQSIVKVELPERSLPTGRIFAVMGIACEATWTPSMVYTIPVLVQSIR